MKLGSTGGANVQTIGGKTANPKSGGGTCSGLVPSLDDPVDLYDVKFASASGWEIWCNPSFDVELFLFKEVSGLKVLVAAADDTLTYFPGFGWFSIQAARIRSTDVVVDPAYKYYLAVTGRGAVPGYYEGFTFYPSFPGQPLNWTGVVTDFGGMFFIPLFEEWSYASDITARGSYTVDVTFLPQYPDECPNARALSLGINHFSTASATTSSAAVPTACSSTAFKKDVWFHASKPCDRGTYVFSTCGHATWDTMLAVYNVSQSHEVPHDCPTTATGGGTEIHQSWCNDDSPATCGFGSLQSFVAIDVADCYFSEFVIRLGGYNGASGSGDLEVKFLAAYDYNDNGLVDAPDLANLLSHWGSPADLCAGADLDGNAVVDSQDLTLLLSRWGSSGD